MSEAAMEMRKQDTGLGISFQTVGFFFIYFCYLSVIPFLFVFVYHIFPTMVLSIIVFFAVCSFIPLGFNRGSAVITEPAGPLLSAGMLICVTLVFVSSVHLYWGHVHPFRALYFAREYNGVYPELPAEGFGDAAYIRFVGAAKVNTAKAVNMMSLETGLTTFCVAPIMSTNNASRVQFWAAGVDSKYGNPTREDCCGKGPRGGFRCDNAEKVNKGGSKAAVVIQNPTDPLFKSVGKYIAPDVTRRDLFLRAIAKAEHEDGLTAPPAADAVLVRFTELTRDQLIEAETGAIRWACIGITALSFVMAVFLAGVGARFSALRSSHRAANNEHHHESLLVEFIHNTADDHLDNLKHVSDFKNRLHAPDWHDWMLFKVCIPFIVLMLCMVLTSYSRCWPNGHLVYAPFLVLLGIGTLALLATPGKMTNITRALWLTLVSLTGIHIGQVNYSTNVFHYCSIEGRRTYSDVLSSASSESYSDAGMLKFGSNAYLSQNHSVGFLYKGVTYCAAPILTHAAECTPPAKSITSAQAQAFLQAEESEDVSSFLQRTSRMHRSLDTDEPTESEDQTGTSVSTSAPSTAPVQCPPVKPSRVEFWAIGTDCCSQRKDFSCDGGTDANAHSAVLVRHSGDEPRGGDREQLFRAVSQAVSAYDLPVPDNPVLIRWGRDPEAMQNDWYKSGLVMVGMTALIGFLLISSIGLFSYWHLRQVFKQHEAEQAEELRERQARPSSTSVSRGGQLRV
jgi:hypothetical protein